MKSKVFLSLICFSVLIVPIASSVVSGESTYPIYRTGGACTQSQFYLNNPGWPPYQKRVQYIGVLKGSWYQMGVQYGERGGWRIRWGFDARWQKLLEKFNNNATTILAGLQKYYDHAALFSPQLIDFMKGEADGASKELDKCIYAGGCSHLMKIMLHNCYSDFYYDIRVEETWKLWNALP